MTNHTATTEAPAETTTEQWVTWGAVRGLGPIRQSRTESERDASLDSEGCAAQGGYSDRHVYRVDGDGWVRDAEGEHVWPHGRTSRALRIQADRG